MDTKFSAGKALAGLALLGAGGIAAVSLNSNDPANSYETETESVEVTNDASRQVNEDDTPTAKTEIRTDTGHNTTRPASSGDKDCGDFSTHSQAQAFFENAGPGDPHGLDRDGDGDACETLP